LKRFQTALKLHAQGPAFFDEASDAYDDLFKSEIFKYPDAATEYDRAERQPDQLSTESPFPPTLDLATGDLDGSGSSLPQALYLSYKNHGQFVLDRIRHRARKLRSSKDEFFDQKDVVLQAQKALSDFYTALDRDPSDAELWRRTARVASFLKSTRTSRFCLEAAIELDDDPAVDQVDPPSLAEALAGEQLKNQLRVLSDKIGLSHPIMSPWIEKDLPALVKRQLDPLPYLPDFSKQLAVPQPKDTAPRPARVVLQVPRASWADLGLAMIHFVSQQGFSGEAVTTNKCN
jgi:tetratricopeptide (TPR) repeat protein